MPRPDPDTVKLLFGPYAPPALGVGDRADCLSRDCTCRVVSISDAPIPWPKVLPLGGRGQPTLLLNFDLAEAVRREAAAAVAHWWGVRPPVVCRWRKALGVERYNEGSRRLQLRNSERGAEAPRGVALPEDQV